MQSRILTKRQFAEGMLVRLPDGSVVARFYTPIREVRGAIEVIEPVVDEVTGNITHASELFIPLPETE